LRWDDGICEPGGHGEVGDSADEQGDGEEVMEDFLPVMRPEAKGIVDELLDVWLARSFAAEEFTELTNEGEGEASHNGPEPVGASLGEVRLAALRVDVESVITGVDQVHSCHSNEVTQCCREVGMALLGLC
jgi:hypothetical protein